MEGKGKARRRGSMVACQRAKVWRAVTIVKFLTIFVLGWGGCFDCEIINKWWAVGRLRFENEMMAEDVENFFHMWKMKLWKTCG